MQGYYLPSASSRAGRLVPTAPVRVLDTRGAGGPVGAGGTLDVDLQPFGVAADATAAVLKVTVTEAAAAGFWTVFAADAPRPQASNLNVDRPGQTVPNQVITPLAGARARVYTLSGGHLIVDLVGWFTGPSAPPSETGLFVPVTPSRLVDTRNPATGPGVRPPANTRVEVPVAGRAGVPGAGVAAVQVNATVTETDGAGFFSLWPGRTYRPNISSLNAEGSGQTLANHVITPVSASGFDYYTQSGAHLVADITGWFTGEATPSQLPPAVPIPGPAGPPDSGGYLYEWANGPGGTDTGVAGPEYDPFRWDPCAPIRYVVNMNGYDGNFRRTIVEAVERLGTATGLSLVDVGDTDHLPTDADPWGLSQSQMINRSGPYDLIISLADESITDVVPGSVAGIAMYNWLQYPGRIGQFVVASVVIDMGDVGANPEWSSTGPRGRAAARAGPRRRARPHRRPRPDHVLRVPPRRTQHLRSGRPARVVRGGRGAGVRRLLARPTTSPSARWRRGPCAPPA